MTCNHAQSFTPPKSPLAPSLQIRGVAAPLQSLLLRPAREDKRSLGQQALHGLEQRRQRALARLSQLWEGRPRVALNQAPNWV